MTLWSKLHYLCPKKILKKFFFFFTKSSIFLVVFRLWSEHFGLLAKVIWLGCQKVFQVSRGGFRKNCSFKTNSSNWFNFLDFVHKNFGLLAKNFRWVRQNCIQCVQRRFLIGLFFLQKFMSFLTVFDLWGKFPCILGAKASKGLLKLHFTCTKEIFCEILIFEEKNFYKYFDYWSKTLRTFVKIKSAKCQKTHFRAFQRNFFSKVIFFLEKNHVFLRKLREKVFGIR